MSDDSMQAPEVTPPPGGHLRRAVLVVIGVVALVAAVMIAQPGAAVSTAQPPPPPTSDAEPYAQQGFGDELSGDVRDPLDTPETFSHGPTVDGCDHAYGVNGECVPYNFPPGVGDDPASRCTWLRQQGAGALEVPGEDRHGLVPRGGPRAPSGNPYACPDQLPPPS